MEYIDFLAELHLDAVRQGPGSSECTLRALTHVPELTADSLIVDIGCGTGASTDVLASNTHANILAIDFLPNFLEKLKTRISDTEYNHRIVTSVQDMANLELPKASIDLIWSEGAIYNIGFENGLRKWKPFMKKNAHIALSEIVWLSDDRPKEINDYWKSNYSEISTVDEKIRVLERLGFELLDYFTLPEHCWWDNYYRPLQNRIKEYKNKYVDKPEILEFLSLEEIEIELYQKYKSYYSYAFFIARNHSNSK